MIVHVLYITCVCIYIYNMVCMICSILSHITIAIVIYLFCDCIYESESEVTQSCSTLCDPMDCSPARLLCL